MVTAQEWKGRSIETLVPVVERDQHGVGWERGFFGKELDELIERHNIEMILAQQAQFFGKRLGRDDVAGQLSPIDGVIHKHNALIPIIDRFSGTAVNRGLCKRRLAGCRQTVWIEPQNF